MDPMKQIYLLLVCQGFYLGSLCQEWTFPERITALIGSCVEIPCTYDPAGRSGASSIVWFLSTDGPDPQILNTKDPSSVMEKYKDRTSLIPGDHSCTLRIDPVRGEDVGNYYYPGIADDTTINTADRHNRFVLLSVTDKMQPELYLSNRLTEGVATTIRCSVEHTFRSSTPALQWNISGQVQHRSVEISEGSWREESNLTYIPSYLDDGIIIQCTVTYPDGQRFPELGTLHIDYAPKNVTVTVLGKDEVMDGSDVILQCNSFSKRRQVNKYEWYKGKEKTKLPDREREITVRKVTGGMEPYSCTAINAVGRGESALMEIPVLHAPIGALINGKNEGEFTKLTCDFLSSRPDVTHYTWMKDGSILQNKKEKTLTVDYKEQSYGQYSCIAHNRIGNSSSQAFFHKDDTLYLPLIWGTVAGVFLLLLFILIIFLYLRRKKSDLPTSSFHGISNKISNENDNDGNQLGNIQSRHNAQPPSLRSEPSVDVNLEGNQAIYSTTDTAQPPVEVEYSVISHRQHNQAGHNSSRHDEDVEYATLKH